MAFNREPVRAPELRGTAWLNTPGPLSLAHLRGRVVLLDFWTSGCINCLHVLDDLAYLERKYAGRPLTVIGVHSPKFAREEDPATVREAVLRNDVAHPVLLDNQRRTWDAYAVKGWPTLVLVGPDGYILGQVAGEGHRTELDAAVAAALAARDQKGEPAARSVGAELGGASATGMDLAPLRYPGGVLADEALGAVFIADTGHHRLVWAMLDGTLIDTIGSGVAGADDGDFATSSFRAPRGLALDPDRRTLYVADSGNHTIRRVDLAARRVATVAGTGELGYRFGGAGSAREVPLNSPWDVRLLGGQLYIAMAGLHQVWRYDPTGEFVGTVAGSGAEGRADGPAASAAFAQPSGIATDGERLFVADAESSCVRMLTFEQGEAYVQTLAGGDLFLFGDADGVGDDARFQHPTGLCWVAKDQLATSALYVADSYNHRLRRLDPGTREVTTVPAPATAAERDAAEPTLREPSGVSYARGGLYVADTNNHRIRVVDPASGRAATLRIAGLCPPGFCLPE